MLLILYGFVQAHDEPFRSRRFGQVFENHDLIPRHVVKAILEKLDLLGRIHKTTAFIHMRRRSLVAGKEKGGVALSISLQANTVPVAFSVTSYTCKQNHTSC